MDSRRQAVHRPRACFIDGQTEQYVLDLVVNAVDQASTQVDAVGAHMAAVGAQAESFRTRFADANGTMVAWGAGLGVVAAALVAFGIQHAMAFDSALNHVQAFAGGTATEIASWRAAILTMAPTLGLSATNMAQGLYTIASAGIKDGESMIALTAAAHAAAASQTQLTTVIGALVPVINAYHLTASQIPLAMNQMSESVIKGNMEFAQFASSIGSVIPIAAQMGVPLADLGAAMAIMTNQGNSAAESSVLLSNILRGLMAPTRMQETTMRALGATTADITVKNGNLIPVLQRINELVANGAPTWQEIQKNTGDAATTAQRLASQLATTDQRLRAFFGGNSEAMRGFFLLAHNGFNDYAQMIGIVEHSTSDVANSMREAWKNPAFQVQQLKASMETLGITIGEAVLPAFVGLVGAVTPVIQALAAWTNVHPALTEAILATALVLGGLSLAMTGLGGIMYPLQYVLGNMGMLLWLVQGAMEGNRFETEKATASAAQLEIVEARLQLAQERELAILGQMSAEMDAQSAAGARLALAEERATIATQQQILAEEEHNASLLSLLSRIGAWEVANVHAAATAVASAAQTAAAWAGNGVEAAWLRLTGQAAAVETEQMGIARVSTEAAAQAGAAWTASAGATGSAVGAVQLELAGLVAEEEVYVAQTGAVTQMTLGMVAGLDAAAAAVVADTEVVAALAAEQDALASASAASATRTVAAWIAAPLIGTWQVLRTAALALAGDEAAIAVAAEGGAARSAAAWAGGALHDAWMGLAAAAQWLVAAQHEISAAAILDATRARAAWAGQELLGVWATMGASLRTFAADETGAAVAADVSAARTRAAWLGAQLTELWTGLAAGLAGLTTAEMAAADGAEVGAARSAAAWVGAGLRDIWLGLVAGLGLVTTATEAFTARSITSAAASTAAWVAGIGTQLAALAAAGVGFLALGTQQLVEAAATQVATFAQTEFGIALMTGDVAMLGRMAITAALAVAEAVATVATGGLTVAVGILDIALMALPFVAIIAAIVALGVAIYELITHWTAFQQAVIGVWDALENKLLAVFYLAGDALGALGSIFDQATGAASRADIGLLNFAGTIGTVVVEALGHLRDALGFVIGKMHDLYDTTLGQAGQQLDTVTNKVREQAQAEKDHEQSILAMARATEQYYMSFDPNYEKQQRFIAQLKQMKEDMAAVQAAAVPAAQIVRELQQDAASSLQTFAVGILQGADNLGQLKRVAADAAQGALSYATTLARANQQIAEATGQWGKAVSDEAGRLKTSVDDATGALVIALQRHGGNITQLAEAAARTEATQRGLTDAQTEAAVKISLASGVASAGLSQFTGSFASKVTGATDLLAVAMMTHSGNETALSEKLVQAQQKLDGYTEAHTRAVAVLETVIEAEIRHAIATGQANAAVMSYSSTLSTKANSSLELLTQAILHHATNIDALAVQARADQQKLVDYGQAHKDATAMVGATSAALKDLSTRLSEAARTTMTALVDAAYRGQGGLDALRAKAVVAADAQQRYADTTLAQTIKVDAAAGNFAGVFDARRRQLEDAVTKWTDALAMAKPGTATYAYDEGKLRAANAQLDGFNSSLKTASDAGHAVAESFAVVSQAAADKASRALDAYSLALATGKGNLDELRQAAVSTAQTAAQYTDARSKAEAEVQAALHVTAQTFTQLETQLRTRTAQALETYLLMVEKGGNTARDVNDAWLRLLSTTASQDAAARLRSQVDQEVALHSRDVSVAMDALRSSLDTGLKAAEAQYVSDLLNHTGSLKADAASIKAHEASVTENAAAWAKAAAVATGVDRSFAGLQQSADTKARSALDALADGIRLGRTDLDGLREKAVAAARGSEVFATSLKTAQDEVTRALTAVSSGVSDFKTTLDALTKAIADEMNTIESLILNHQQNFAAAPNPAQERQYGGEVPRQTQMQAAMDALTQLYIRQAQLLGIQQEAEMRAARASGDWATVLKLSEDKISHDYANALDHATVTILNHGAATQAEVAALQRAAGARERETLALQQAGDLEVQADIRAAQAAGDLATAFDLLSKSDTAQLARDFSALEGAFRTGSTDVAALAATYQAHRQQVELDTQAEIRAYEATGQYSQALSKLSQETASSYGDALAKVTLDIYDLGHASQADIQAAEQGRAATQRWTQAQWDATFATADLATQTSMLKSLFSGLIAGQQEQQRIDTATDSANIAILKANSDIAVAELAAQTTALTDMKGLIDAQAAVAKAEGDGQVKSIDDQTGIMKALWEVQGATSPQALAVARDHLAIARVQYAADQAASQWDVRIAEQQLVMAQSKASWDQAVAAADMTVKQDALTVARDQYQIALDTQAIDIQQLTVMNDINSNLGAVNDYGDAIRSDLARLTADQGTLRADQLQQAADQAAQAAVAAQAQLASAQGAIVETEDKAAQQQQGLQYSVQLAQLNQMLASDEHLQQIAQSGASTAANTQTLANQNATLIAQQNATIDTLKRAMTYMATGMPARGSASVSGQDYSSFIHGWAADALSSVSMPK